MKSLARVSLILVAALAVLELSASVALAGGGGGGGFDTPEINPGVLGSASALLAGGAILIRDTLRRK